jgi:hypothetical protein
MLNPSTHLPVTRHRAGLIPSSRLSVQSKTYFLNFLVPASFPPRLAAITWFGGKEKPRLAFSKAGKRTSPVFIKKDPGRKDLPAPALPWLKGRFFFEPGK